MKNLSSPEPDPKQNQPDKNEEAKNSETQVPLSHPEFPDPKSKVLCAEASSQDIKIEG